MKLKILHLNIQYGKYLPEIIKFAKQQSFDVLSLQEVANKISRFKGGPECFERLKRSLNLEGQLGTAWRDVHDKNSYFGNAILYRKKFTKLRSKILSLRKFRVINPNKVSFQGYPRCALAVTLEIKRKPVTFISTHLVWGPNPQDKKYKLAENHKLVSYTKSLKTPFVLTGDFNLTPDSKIIFWFGQIAQNLIAKNKVTNTLNPRTHYAPKLFPNGLAVDYIFVSKNLKVKSFKVIDNLDLSDHFALVAEIEI